jgi:hypothetical protein
VWISNLVPAAYAADVALIAGWAVLGILACLPFVFDSSMSDGPRAPLALLATVLACAAPAFIGGAFAVIEAQRPYRNFPVIDLLRRLPRPIRVGLAVVSLVAAGVFLSGVVNAASADSVKTGTGYAFRLRSGELLPVTEQEYLANRRAERRMLLGAAIWCNAWGGALCWATKLRDDEEDPL